MKKLSLLLCLLLVAHNAVAADIVWLHSATQATQGIQEFVAFTAGTPSSSTSNALYGGRTLRLAAGDLVVTAPVANTVGRMTAWFYHETAFPTDDGSYYFALATVANYGLRVRYDSASGKLGLVSYNGTTVNKLGTTVLSLATHYRIALSFQITSDSDWDAKVYLTTAEGTAGTLEITASDADGDLGGFTAITNVQHSHNAGSGIIYVSPFYYDNGSDLTDPGDIRVTSALYNAESTNNFDTAIGNARGSTDYNNVNERALSETNGWQHAASGVVEESYTVEGAADADVNITGKTVVGHAAWVWAKAGGATSGAKLIRNGTDVAIDLTTTSNYLFSPATSATYPAGTFGMKSSGDANDTFFYEGGALIAYDQAGGAPAGTGYTTQRGIITP